MGISRKRWTPGIPKLFPIEHTPARNWLHSAPSPPSPWPLSVMRTPVALPPSSYGKVRAVPEYRVYTVGPDGHFQSAVRLICPDDETAKEQAKQLIDGLDIELWQQARKVATFEHKP